LILRKKLTEESQRKFDQWVDEQRKTQEAQVLSRADLQPLIDGFKRKWDFLHHQYQGLSVVTDTAPKKARKERIELAMHQIEKDIKLLEDHANVMIQ